MTLLISIDIFNSVVYEESLEVGATDNPQSDFNVSEIYALVPVRFNHKNVADPLTRLLLDYHLMIYTLVNDHITARFPTASPEMRFAFNYNLGIQI